MPEYMFQINVLQFCDMICCQITHMACYSIFSMVWTPGWYLMCSCYKCCPLTVPSTASPLHHQHLVFGLFWADCKIHCWYVMSVMTVPGISMVLQYISDDSSDHVVEESLNIARSLTHSLTHSLTLAGM